MAWPSAWAEVELSRHAKNRARKLGASLADIEEAIANAIDVEEGDDGKSLYIARIRGVSVRIVLALDDPDFVVTIHEKRR